MHIKIEITLSNDQKEAYGTSMIELFSAKNEFKSNDLSLPEFQAKALTILTGIKAELQMAFSRLTEAQQARAEKSKDA